MAEQLNVYDLWFAEEKADLVRAAQSNTFDIMIRRPDLREQRARLAESRGANIVWSLTNNFHLRFNKEYNAAGGLHPDSIDKLSFLGDPKGSMGKMIYPLKRVGFTNREFFEDLDDATQMTGHTPQQAEELWKAVYPENHPQKDEFWTMCYGAYCVMRSKGYNLAQLRA